MNSEIVILMPVYNPREEIINYIKELKKERYSIVVVNDGSDENIILFLKVLLMIVQLLTILFLKEKEMLLMAGSCIFQIIYRERYAS